jgi:hypothetical protein
MTPKQAWKKLGLDPSDDKRAIKRAYAAKLKAIDPDADPKAFLALRQALEIAQWEAEYGGEDDEYEEEEDVFVPDGPQWSAAADDEDFGQVDPRPESAPEPLPERLPVNATPMLADDVDLQQRIDGLIWQEDRAADGDAALVEAMRRLLADPAMDQVDYASETEEWLARTMAYAMPQSDPVIPMVVAHFGWEARRMNVRETFGLAECAARADDLACLARLSAPSHRWHGAFELLRAPGPSRIGFFDRRKHKAAVVDLLTSLRTHNPGAEHALNAEHVAQWEDILRQAEHQKASTGSTSDWGGWRFGFFALIILAQFARFCSADVDRPISALPPIGLPQIEIYMWRSEQLPRVQTWMDDHRSIVEAMFYGKIGTVAGMPSCSVLDASAKLTTEEFDHCYASQAKREARNQLPQPSTDIAQVPSPAAPTTVSYYYFPGWQKEQAPRVQEWMDTHRAEIDRLVRPYLKTNRVPDCRELAALAGLNTSEMSQCRAAQRRREAPIAPAIPAAIPPVLPPQAPKPLPEPMPKLGPEKEDCVAQPGDPSPCTPSAKPMLDQ